jgi:hypothetical protein
MDLFEFIVGKRRAARDGISKPESDIAGRERAGSPPVDIDISAE